MLNHGGTTHGMKCDGWQYLVAEAGQALGRGLRLVVQGCARGAQLIELPQVLSNTTNEEQRSHIGLGLGLGVLVRHLGMRGQSRNNAGIGRRREGLGRTLSTTVPV